MWRSPQTVRYGDLFSELDTVASVKLAPIRTHNDTDRAPLNGRIAKSTANWRDQAD